jgi:hypothetical protein
VGLQSELALARTAGTRPLLELSTPGNRRGHDAQNHQTSAHDAGLLRALAANATDRAVAAAKLQAVTTM